jgi:uncharacterized membrane protein
MKKIKALLPQNRTEWIFASVILIMTTVVLFNVCTKSKWQQHTGFILLVLVIACAISTYVATHRKKPETKS